MTSTIMGNKLTDKQVEEIVSNDMGAIRVMAETGMNQRGIGRSVAGLQRRAMQEP